MVLRPPAGGATNHVAQLSRALTERGHDVAVCGPHGENRDDFAAEVIDVQMGRDPSPLADLRAVREVAAAYRGFRPDLIHAHGSKGPTFARLARYTRPRTPVVITPHNYAFTNYMASARARVAYRVLETALAPLASRVICVCESELTSAQKVGSARRARLVYNGIEPFRAIEPNPVADGLAAKGPLLAAIALLQPPKGLPTLIEAMPRILESHPTASLAVAGEGFLRPDLERQIAALGLGGRVRLLGQLADVSGLLDHASAFVLPSWSEAFPYTVLEAMSLAKPVVASDVGGVAEAVVDGSTGLLVPPRQPAALADAVTRVLDDPELRRALGERGRERVLENFTLDRTLAGVLAVYAELGLT